METSSTLPPLHLTGPRDASWTTSTSKHVIPGIVNNSLISLAMPNLHTVTRHETLDYFENTWALTETLFGCLQGLNGFLQPPAHALRHPMIFYYGHPTVFYINKLRLTGVITEPLNAHFEDLFEVGVDEMNWDDMSKNEMTWPSLEDVHEYRKKVYLVLKDIIKSHPELKEGHAPITKESALWALFMGLEHDRIHLETSSVLFRQMPLEFVQRPTLLPPNYPLEVIASCDDETEEEWISHAGGAVTLGKPDDAVTFGWDNEYGSKQVQVSPFQVRSTLITNSEYYRFVKSGGYADASVWGGDGWDWRKYCNVQHPTFWKNVGPQGLHDYALRTLFEEIEMQWNWPVEVNHHEAEAYCTWKAREDQVPKYTLMSESMHALLRDDMPENVVDFPKNKSFATAFDMNLNTSFTSPSPVKAFPPNALGVYDIMGNVWELCSDFIAPFEGFEVHPIYSDFTTPCFDGKHQMILGGSFMSSGDNGASIYSRYHFRKHFHQHAGFRLVLPSQVELSSSSFTQLNAEEKFSLSQLNDMMCGNTVSFQVPLLDMKEEASTLTRLQSTLSQFHLVDVTRSTLALQTTWSRKDVKKSE